EATGAHLDAHRSWKMSDPLPTDPQKTNEPGRSRSRDQSEQQVWNNLPVPIQLEWRDLIKRSGSEKTANSQGGNHGSENERSKNFHRHRAEHDFGNEHRASDGSIVSGGDSGRGPAADQQP